MLQLNVYSVSLANLRDQEKENFLLLSKEERARVQRFRFPAHCTRYIAARATLRKILSRYLDCPPEKIRFDYNVYQKPFLANPHQTKLSFNLAHTGDQAIYVVSSHQAVGIDIETLRPTYNEKLLKHFFTQEEQTALQALPEAEKAAAFYLLWTKKEAVIKALGKSVFSSLPPFSTSVKTDTPSERVTVNKKVWYIKTVPAPPHFVAAVADEKNADIILSML